MDCVERDAQRGGYFFCFRFEAQSFAKFYTELHGDFFEEDCVEIGTQMKRIP